MIKNAMPTDLTVILEHRPGELARLGEITGEVGVSIRGLAAFTGEGRGVVHLLLDDQAVARCREALERSPAMSCAGGRATDAPAPVLPGRA